MFSKSFYAAYSLNISCIIQKGKIQCDWQWLASKRHEKDWKRLHGKSRIQIINAKVLGQFFNLNHSSYIYKETLRHKGFVPRKYFHTFTSHWNPSPKKPLFHTVKLSFTILNKKRGSQTNISLIVLWSREKKRDHYQSFMFKPKTINLHSLFPKLPYTITNLTNTIQTIILQAFKPISWIKLKHNIQPSNTNHIHYNLFIVIYHNL